MPKNANTFRNLFKSTWRPRSYLSGLVGWVILRHCPRVVASVLGSAFKLLRGSKKRGSKAIASKLLGVSKKFGSTACASKLLSDCKKCDSAISASKLLEETKKLDSATMAAISPIDISSSDSELDWDLDDYRERDDTSPTASTSLTVGRKLPSSMVSSVNSTSATSSTSGRLFPHSEPPTRNLSGATSSTSGRKLPPSVAPSPSRNFPGCGGQLEKHSSAKRAPTSNGNSSNISHHSPAKLQLPSLSNNARQANFHMARNDNLNDYRTDDYRKHSSAGSSNLVENVGGSQNRETLIRSNSSSWITLNNGKNHFRDHFGQGDDHDVIMYQSTGNRVLPPSLVHGKSGSTLQHVNPNDPLYRPGVGEERVAGGDERLIYQAALQDLNQPKVEANLPEGLLSVSLLRHQKIALAWMLQKETRSLHCLGGILADDQGLGKTVSMIALIQMQKSLQAKCKSEHPWNHKTEALNLDEDDDNGGAALDKAKQSVESEDIKPKSEGSTSKREFRRGRPAAGTLVVCPASVLRQWARELDEKVADEAKLKVLVYHGGNRTKDPVELARYDVVLTTYSIVTNEVPKQPWVEEDDDEPKNRENYGLSSEFSFNKKRKMLANGGKKRKKGRKGIDSSAIDCGGALSKVGWFRIILDEAQTIKNHRTQVARACCGLRAKRRWCLSGTPIQNAIDELFSYFRFLRYDPYAVYKSFCNTIKIPISRNSIHGYKKLQAVLRAIMLRRTKGTLIDGEPIIRLPPKTVWLNKVDFSSEERAFYSRLEADSRLKFKAYAAAGTVNQNYANILLMLLRLRQACDHPLLVKEYNSDSVGKVSLEMAKRLPMDMLVNLLNLLETSLAICRVCNDPPEDAVVTMCGHVFCYQCVSDYLTGDDNTCPVHECKEQLGADVVFSKATLKSCLSELDGNASSSSQVSNTCIVLQNEYSSSKIRAALEIIQTHCLSKSPGSMLDNFVDNGEISLVRIYTDACGGAAEHCGVSEPHFERPIKAIIFSQWTGMLDLVEMTLNQHFIQYRRLDGTMTLSARDTAVKEFNTDPEVTVMLMSLKAGNLGLNMVAACHVILLDLWWNPTTEDQAIDRAHRIGQTRPVTVSRLTIKDTVEDRILALQEEKRKMVASAFGEDQSGGSATRLTVEDLKYLFMV